MTEEVDSTLVGATCEVHFQQVRFGVNSESGGQRAESSVITAKRHIDIASRSGRWFGSGSGGYPLGPKNRTD